MSTETILRTRAQHYPNLNDVIKHVNKLTKQYTELRVNVSYFTHNNGSQENLINLDGTIPVFYKQRKYNIPIVIWLLDKHPIYAPMVYVQPTATMVIRQGRHVDASGKVYLPYLSEWKPKKSDLSNLVNVLCTVFGQEPPVVAKPAGAPARPAMPAQPPIRSATAQATPYPQTQYNSAQQFQPPYPSQNQQFAPYPQQSHQNVHGPPTTGGYMPQQSPYPQGNSFPSHPPTSQPYQPPVQPPAYGYIPTQQQMPMGKANNMQSDVDDSIILASVRESVNDTLKRRTNDIIIQLNSELSTLRATENELKLGKSKIGAMVSTLDGENAKCADVLSKYETQNNEMDREIENLEGGNTIDPGQIITPSTPIYKQIFNAHAQEQAIEDAIYFISKALSRGSIDCETYLRYVRRLSRQQYEMKETVIKAREAAKI